MMLAIKLKRQNNCERWLCWCRHPSVNRRLFGLREIYELKYSFLKMWNHSLLLFDLWEKHEYNFAILQRKWKWIEHWHSVLAIFFIPCDLYKASYYCGMSHFRSRFNKITEMAIKLNKHKARRDLNLKLS